MALDWLLEDAPSYVTRGQRILSVLNGSGSVDVLPGRPDVVAEPSDFDKGEKFNPDIDFDPNAFSRMDKFDGLEVGQELIDSMIDKAKPTSDFSNSEEK
nr:MAG TPA: hypothetical protein [Microviridae sp.]